MLETSRIFISSLSISLRVVSVVVVSVDASSDKVKKIKIKITGIEEANVLIAALPGVASPKPDIPGKSYSAHARDDAPHPDDMNTDGLGCEFIGYSIPVPYFECKWCNRGRLRVTADY